MKQNIDNILLYQIAQKVKYKKEYIQCYPTIITSPYQYILCTIGGNSLIKTTAIPIINQKILNQIDNNLLPWIGRYLNSLFHHPIFIINRKLRKLAYEFLKYFINFNNEKKI